MASFPEILIDTSALFALINRDDPHHTQAVRLHQALIHRKATLVLPNFLLAETHTVLLKRVGASAAREFLHAAARDFVIERVTLEDERTAYTILSHPLESEGVSYFDAVAAAVAERLGIKEIFSFDRHFDHLGVARFKS